MYWRVADMSPEIFSNKPYSYKSDVWALGCVLYEMTTLNHAFDANSLNGLAGKIIKGRYPPIHQKYSKYLRDLIASMLQTNPQQRPDLDQILHKSFIKKHVVNFFTDIASRPSQGIGEGTMLIRAAVGGAAPNAPHLSNDSNLLALQKQLQDLDMADAVTEALAPKPAVPPADPLEAKKLVKDQVSALRREEDHKKMVESALEKLRQERELRAKERNIVVGGNAAGGVPRNRPGYNQPSAARQEPVKPAAARVPPASSAVANSAADAVGAVSRKSPAGVSDSGSSKGAEAKETSDSNSNAGPRRRRQTLEDQQKAAEREVKQAQPSDECSRRSEAANKERSEFRKRQDVLEQARLREEAKAREELKLKEEAANRQKIDELRAQADAAARREALQAQQRDKERARQRDEIDQLRRDQLDLDRKLQERDRMREEKRAEERKKIEDQRRAAGVGPVFNNDRDADVQITPRGLAGGVSNINISGMSRVAEEKTELTNRDKILQRKLERQAREDQDRAEELRLAEVENRRLRALADAQKRKLYEDSPGSVLPKSSAVSAKPTVVPMARLGDENDEIEEARTLRRMQQRDVSDADSDEVSEDDEIFTRNNEVVNEEDVIEEDEDIQRREEDLKAELNFATLRCQELHRTLQETKSFIDHSNGQVDTRQIRPANGKVNISTIESMTEAESDYEENFDADDATEIVVSTSTTIHQVTN
jgi:hypothetical protein